MVNASIACASGSGFHEQRFEVLWFVLDAKRSTLGLPHISTSLLNTSPFRDHSLLSCKVRLCVSASTFLAKVFSVRRAAINSSSFIWRSFSSRVHIHPVLPFSYTPPHANLEASENTVTTGGSRRMGAQVERILRSHQRKRSHSIWTLDISCLQKRQAHNNLRLSNPRRPYNSSYWSTLMHELEYPFWKACIL